MVDHMNLKLVADLPVASRTVDHLQALLDTFTTEQLADRLVGFRRMLEEVPADDDTTMRATIEALRDVLAAELAARVGDAARKTGPQRPAEPR